MNVAGCFLSLMAGGFLLVGLIPLLGWLNWFTSLPFSIIAGILCYLSLRERPGDALAQIGLVASVLIFCVVLFRLTIGGGLI